MKAFFAFLSVGMLLAGTAQSQTQSTTNPTSTTTPSPASTTATTGQPSVGTAAPAALPAPMSPSRRQELYDEHHGITRKRAAPTTPSGQQTGRPTPQPTPSGPAYETERPLSSDGSASSVRIGIRGGVTRPVYLEKPDGITIDPTLSFVGGFVFNFGKGAISFQPELNYARYAFKRSGLAFGGSTTTTTTSTFATDWFEVPLLLKIATGSVNTSRFFVNVGPYGAYASGASINGQKVSLDNASNRFSFGAAAGVGAALKAGPGHVVIELRGLYQLSDTNGSVNTDSRLINTQATVGYMFPLGGKRY